MLLRSKSERKITRKWYNIELYLQWRTDRKSYMIYRLMPCSTTLNDFKPRFQWKYLGKDVRWGQNAIYRMVLFPMIFSDHSRSRFFNVR